MAKHAFKTTVPRSVLFPSQQHAHDELLKTFFAAVREAEAITGRRWTDRTATRHFRILWTAWRRYAPPA